MGGCMRDRGKVESGLGAGTCSWGGGVGGGGVEVGWVGAWMRGKKKGWMNVSVCNFSEERGRIACGWEQYQLSKLHFTTSMQFHCFYTEPQ